MSFQKRVKYGRMGQDSEVNEGGHALDKGNQVGAIDSGARRGVELPALRIRLPGHTSGLAFHRPALMKTSECQEMSPREIL